MKWYFKVLMNYANFNGRARRSEFWYFILFTCVFAIVASVLDNIIGTTFKGDPISMPYGFLFVLYFLAIIIPYLAVLVRRLHDIGKSGWWYFISFIPIVGSIWLLVLLFTDSTPGENQYGPNPKTVTFEDRKDILDTPS